jgi:hypothetical protein
VITDLANDVMPFINSDLGDTAVATGPCRCRRGFPTVGAVEGRTSEALRMANGRVVPAGVLEGFLLWGCGELPHIWEQMERDASGKRFVVKSLVARDESASGPAR